MVHVNALLQQRLVGTVKGKCRLLKAQTAYAVDAVSKIDITVAGLGKMKISGKKERITWQMEGYA